MALWLDLRLTCSPEGAPSRYYKLDQMPMPAEVTGPSLEATAVVLLNGYMPTKLPSAYLCLLPQISTALNSGYRSSFLQ